ncbi:MAG TPA: twin-arginine translocase TatA/TatE family subunit [Aurantimonas sp.]|uniref:Sec-independent protein translocase protein TatA n=1 Tax=Aurantimonas marianensis TaxID=2920428 RepID=A0A9X2KF31_9HYPH|nr:twin-arginine translocase TatA/TatE family subunit [Aurantimonas marianensis]MCP3055314.1 twin-arginine translocase TatA/TatE family subunit [Aurantimonas marianensis]
MGSFSIWHWLIVLAVVLLLFGRGKIPELMGDVAKGIKSFKKGMSDEDAEKTETAQERRTLDHTEGDVVRHDVATKKTVN